MAVDLTEYKAEPIQEYKMVTKRGTGTVCAVLRDAYKRTDSDDVKILLRIATTMCKKMAEKLRYYHKTYGGDDAKR